MIFFFKNLASPCEGQIASWHVEILLISRLTTLVETCYEYFVLMFLNSLFPYICLLYVPLTYFPFVCVLVHASFHHNHHDYHHFGTIVLVRCLARGMIYEATVYLHYQVL